VPVELAADDEVGERVLLDVGCREVCRPFLADDCIEQRFREDKPSDPERRCKRLARRAAVDDAVGLEALEGADRQAVVAVLGVVIVLDRDRVALSQPIEQGGAPLSREDGAGEKLVRGVTMTAPTSARSSSSTRRPLSSTPIGTSSRPARCAVSRCSGWLGSSTAIRLTPPAASARQTRPWPCA
jgi:hypothetical protein